MKRRSFLILIFFLVISCEEKGPEFNPPFDMSQIWEIHHQTEWDSLSTANHLIGKWKWNYHFCCGEGTKGELFTDEENLVLEFFTDGTMEVSEKNISKQNSDWYLKIEDSELYGIVAKPYVDHIHGRIFFTETGLLFNDTFRDGADDYFIRIE